jgi:hypothetical protein
MKRLVMVPEGWPCKLKEAPCGPFVWDDMLCFKSDHKDENRRIMAFGEFGVSLWYSAGGFVPMDDLMVQPVVAKWEDDSE